MTKKQNSDENSGRNKSSLYLEMNKTGSFSRFFINRITRVEGLTDESVLLKLNRGAVKISGRTLNLTIYENGSVEICGDIRKVEFL
jgi:hypothetical protein